MFVRSLDIELMCNPTIHSLGMTTEKYIHVPRKNTYMYMHTFIFNSQKAETAQKSYQPEREKYRHTNIGIVFSHKWECRTEKAVV